MKVFIFDVALSFRGAGTHQFIKTRVFYWTPLNNGGTKNSNQAVPTEQECIWICFVRRVAPQRSGPPCQSGNFNDILHQSDPPCSWRNMRNICLTMFTKTRKAVVTTDFRPIAGRGLFYKYVPYLILARVESQSALEPHQPREPHAFRMVQIVSAPGGRHVFHKHTPLDYQLGFVASIGAHGLHCFHNFQMGSPNSWCGFGLLYLRNNYLVRVQQRLCNCFGFIGGSLGRRSDWTRTKKKCCFHNWGPTVDLFGNRPMDFISNQQRFING